MNSNRIDVSAIRGAAGVMDFAGFCWTPAGIGRSAGSDVSKHSFGPGIARMGTSKISKPFSITAEPMMLDVASPSFDFGPAQ